ncbi:MAG TPA: acetyl-CoA carboxylase biotin carboxylase subunit [Terriglobales bacterium]|nr:acetyl-CoA carboxylase biotin carboxylase subunit [Terriglobales bacterium]
MSRLFSKILIANRGEIAVRLIRACHELGIKAVAVYSEADRASLHVRKADEAYAIGPAAASESYLNIERIIGAAKKSGAEAIHPGYGFLSENAAFAQACADAGVKFIGPNPKSIEMMGSKTGARRQMEKAGVPFVPGSSRGLQSAAEARDLAARFGYPIMLKAAAGGGGKGMRLVAIESDLSSALDAARSEAKRAFGDDEVYLEKAIVNPRHIEMQVLADEHGNCVYLGERECSIQRRHQKVLEESPSVAVTPEMRRRMGETAVRAAQAANYVNAGTIEFLADAQNNFYFLEMNTRLQVEHPVTELITGLDLVHLQIRIAAGEKLPFTQEQIAIRGHAIECRVYAEDPDNNFFPSPGNIALLVEPAGPGIRLDSGIYAGWNVPVEYDPLLAKLVASGSSRTDSIGKLKRAVDEYVVGGVKTNIALFRRILNDPDFISGKTDTGYLSRLAPEPKRQSDERDQEIAAIAAAIATVLAPANGTKYLAEQAFLSRWKQASRNEALE